MCLYQLNSQPKSVTNDTHVYLYIHKIYWNWFEKIVIDSDID